MKYTLIYLLHNKKVNYEDMLACLANIAVKYLKNTTTFVIYIYDYYQTTKLTENFIHCRKCNEIPVKSGLKWNQNTG